MSKSKSVTRTAKEWPSKEANPLLWAARRVYDAYLKYGPVNDGRPEGAAFEAALDDLSNATIEAKYADPTG